MFLRGQLAALVRFTQVHVHQSLILIVRNQRVGNPFCGWSQQRMLLESFSVLETWQGCIDSCAVGSRSPEAMTKLNCVTTTLASCVTQVYKPCRMGKKNVASSEDQLRMGATLFGDP
jgi:hypothetical protein